MHSSSLQRLFEYVFDNLFDILTIAVASYLIIRHQIQPYTSTNLPDLAAGILAVLGLLAVSGLWDRHRRLNRIEKLSEESRNLALRYLSKEVRAEDFFLSDRKLSNKDLASATTIFFVGKMLARTTRDFEHTLRQRLASGAHIRFIILDSEHDQVLQQAVLKSVDLPLDFWRNTLHSVETIIKAIARTQSSTGKVELGYLPYVPSFGMVMIDPDQPHGFCVVEIYHHRSPEQSLVFEIRARNDQHWYSFFRVIVHGVGTSDGAGLPAQ